MDIGFRWVNTHIKAYGCWFAIGYQLIMALYYAGVNQIMKDIR